MKAQVSNEDFVVAWTTSPTIEDVIAGTGMTRTAIRARAAFLKKYGVKLKDMPRTTNRLDHATVAELNAIINRNSR